MSAVRMGKLLSSISRSPVSTPKPSCSGTLTFPTANSRGSGADSKSSLMRIFARAQFFHFFSSSFGRVPKITLGRFLAAAFALRPVLCRLTFLLRAPVFLAASKTAEVWMCLDADAIAWVTVIYVRKAQTERRPKRTAWDTSSEHVLIM